MRHHALIRHINAWPRDSPSHILDNVQFFLACLLVALDADRGGVRLDDPVAVDAVRSNFAGLLHRYLRRRYGEDSAARRMRDFSTSVVGHARESCRIAASAGHELYV